VRRRLAALALAGPPAAIFLALTEKTRWSMGVAAVAAFAVAVMTARLQQIWNLGG